MKFNATAINEHLPKNIRYYNNSFSQFYGREFNRSSAKSYADEYLKILQEEQQKKIDKAHLERRLAPLYRYCIPYKVDAYSAMCRFMEYKYADFVLCPTRIYKDIPEEKGYWYNPFRQETGYYKQSCHDLMVSMLIKNHCEYILDNLQPEYYAFVDKFHKVLLKHHKRWYVDYSHMAYNNSADDL